MTDINEEFDRIRRAYGFTERKPEFTPVDMTQRVAKLEAEYQRLTRLANFGNVNQQCLDEVVKMMGDQIVDLNKALLELRKDLAEMDQALAGLPCWSRK